MTNPTPSEASLTALASQVESASGPDHELDAAIEIAVHGFPEDAYAKRYPSWPNDRTEFILQWTGCNWTSSLDAAMSLVPEGFMWRVQAWPDGVNEAILERGAGDFGAIDARHTGKFSVTPALALCAAALSARAALASNSGGEG
jgi:hypothetical protein